MRFTPESHYSMAWKRFAKWTNNFLIYCFISFWIEPFVLLTKISRYKLSKSQATTWATLFCILGKAYGIYYKMESFCFIAYFHGRYYQCIRAIIQKPFFYWNQNTTTSFREIESNRISYDTHQ